MTSPRLFLAAAALVAAAAMVVSCSSPTSADDVGSGTADTYVESDTPAFPDAATPDVGGPQCDTDADCVAWFAEQGEELGDCRVAVCSATGRCEARPRKENEPCDDGLICTIGSVCVQGECRGGTPVLCEDDDPCTDAVCREDGGCELTPLSDVACDDGNPCTVDDTCDEGVCVGDAGGCGQCTDDESCRDGSDTNLCNGVLVCRDGACVVDPDSVVYCDRPDDPCRRSRCNPDTGECELVDAPDGVLCTDDSNCTWDDHCEAGECVGVGLDCSDDDACTVDNCDAAGGCVHEAVDCDDGDACTVDGCEPDSGCFHRAVRCDDENACTEDTCDPTDGCEFTTVSCDDGNACTTDECHEVLGCVHDTVDCDDGDACTTDGCDTETGCHWEPYECPVEDACTLASCDPDDGCSYSARDCDDDDPCTVDDCDAEQGCTWTPVVCPDDGNACTTGTCDADGVCQYEETVVCPNDGDACTVESCDPAQGCVADALDCDDGDACTVDTCDAATGCQHAPLVCDDDDACTQNLCDTNAGCVFPPVVCNDDDACTADTCDPESGCAFDAIDCDDDVACTIDSCDSATGCVYDDSLCGLEYDCGDGVDNDEDGRTDCRDDECWGLEACLGLYPEIVIDYPPRAGVVEGAQLVTIEGHVTAPTGPVTEIDLTFDGVTHTLAPTPDTGAFQLTVESAHGLNPIVAEANGPDGLGARLVQGFLWSPEWRQVSIEDLPGSAVPLGLRGYLDQDFFDDGDPSDADDLAGLLIAALETIDARQLVNDFLPHPLTTLADNPLEPGCGAEVDATPHPTDPMWESVEVRIDLRDGGIEFNLWIHGITMNVDLVGIGEGCSSLSSVLRIPTLTVMLRLALDKEPGQPLVTAVERINVDMPEHLTLDPCAFACGLEFVAAAVIQGMAEEEIEAALPGLLQDYLGDFQHEQPVDFTAPDSLLPGAATASITAWLGLEGLHFTRDGADLLFDASVAAARAVPHPADASLGRADCLDPAPPDFDFVRGNPLELALHDDVLNEALFAVFLGGGMVAQTTLDAVGVDLAAHGITDVSLQVDAWLPGVLTGCPQADALWFELGDVAVHADFLLDGVAASAELFFSLVADVAPSVSATPEGSLVALDIVGVPFFDVGVLSVDGGGVAEPRALLDARLTGGLAESVRTQLLAHSIEVLVPTVDVSGLIGDVLPGLPAGIDLLPTLTTVLRRAGFTTVAGGVEVLLPSP